MCESEFLCENLHCKDMWGNHGLHVTFAHELCIQSFIAETLRPKSSSVTIVLDAMT